jgi:hypothetical protein
MGLGFELKALYSTTWATFQSIFFWISYGDEAVGLMNYLLGLALNHDPPNFSLPSKLGVQA